MKNSPRNVLIVALGILLSVAVGCGSNNTTTNSSNTNKQNTAQVTTTQPAKENTVQEKKLTQEYASPQTNLLIGIQGTITGSDVNFRENILAHCRGGKVVDSLDKGQTAQVMGYLMSRGLDSWYKIKLPDGRVGYVSSRYFKVEQNIAKIWDGRYAKHEYWKHYIEAVKSIDSSITGKEEWNDDDVPYYGRRFMTCDIAIRRQHKAFAAIVDTNKKVVGMIAWYGNDKPKEYYWLSGNKLSKTTKQDVLAKLGDDTNMIAEID